MDSFYRFAGLSDYHSYLGLLAIVLSAGLVILLLRRLPAADLLGPALRPALAVGLSWLVLWPYQLPWYDAMAICLLLFYPVTRLDWLVITRLTVATLANMIGNPGLLTGHLLGPIDRFTVHRLAPAVLLACCIWLVVMACTGQWGLRGGASDRLAE